ncbi:hypothetical protein SLA2020_443340 [Shorea laevis]
MPGPYYCSVGTGKVGGHDIVNSHHKACLYAGINITGINAEVMPGQWEFQVGLVVGITTGRIIEIAGVDLSFDPKPVQGD